MPEVLLAFISLVNRDGEVNFLNVRGNFAKVDFNFFVVAFAFAGQVVAEMFDAAGRVFKVAVENEIAVVVDFAACTEAKCRRVKVKCRAAVVFVGVPAESD